MQLLSYCHQKEKLQLNKKIQQEKKNNYVGKYFIYSSGKMLYFEMVLQVRKKGK